MPLRHTAYMIGTTGLLSNLSYGKLSAMPTETRSDRRTTVERTSLGEYARDCGRRVMFRRMAMDLTQIDLAARLEVTQSALSLWEKGKRLPSDYMRGRLAYELDRDVMELYPPVGRIAKPRNDPDDLEAGAA